MSANWTTAILASTVFAPSDAPVNVGLPIPAPANQKVEFEAQLVLSNGSSEGAACPGVAWGVGLAYGLAEIRRPVSQRSETLDTGNANTPAVQAGSADSEFADQTYLATIKGTFQTGPAPVTVQLTLAASEGYSYAAVKSGSFVKYRVIP